MALRAAASHRTGAAALCFAALSACADRLTAPQAEQLVLATEAIAKGEPSEVVDSLWARIGLPVRLPGALSRIVVEGGWGRREFIALAFERVMIPEHGLSGDRCGGTRRVLLLQSPRSTGERAVLHGVDYALPISADSDTLCGGWGVPFRAPYLAIWRGYHDHWVGTEGNAGISPAVSLGPCTVVSADAERFLQERFGMSCEYTRHHVELRALLKPDSRSDGATRLGPSRRRLSISPTEVRGVRITIDCAATPDAAQLCGAPLE